MKHRFYRRYGKRLIDLMISVPALLLLLPLLLVTGLLVRILLGAPVLYVQRRPGLNGRLFPIYKFRSMTDARDAVGNLLSDDLRLTRFGKFLRASSLDELPELLNVVLGQMSLIGPRPLMSQYLDLYTAEQARRHDVYPGITGWAQVNGRNAVDWEQRFELDVWYVDHYSLWLDIQILWRTIGTVFARKGISATGHCTMPPFEGSRGTIRTAVIGAGGHGRVVVSAMQAAGISVDAIFDDNDELWGTKILNVPICGPIQKLTEFHDVRVVIAVGNNSIRQRLAGQLPLSWITVVHPNAYVHHSVTLGNGTVVFAGAVIQPGVSVGRHCIINSSASVDHDCRLGDFSSVGPGAHLPGNVVIGNRSALGTSSCTIPGVEIESDVIVGAGSVVIRHVPRGCTVVGNPARIISQVGISDPQVA